MIIGFMGLNVIIFLCTTLCIIMFTNNLKKISKSIDIYLDPKAYKPKNQVKFISLLVDKYEEYENKSLLDMDVLIYDYFYNYKIGRFKPSRIESIAKKGKRLLWTSIITMVLLQMMTIGLGESQFNSIMIIVSALLGLLVVFFEIYMEIDGGKEKLFSRIKNHLTNEYPQLKTHQKEKQEMLLLLNKIDKLEARVKNPEEIKPGQIQKNKIQDNGLAEEDIANILMHFDISQM